MNSDEDRRSLERAARYESSVADLLACLREGQTHDRRVQQLTEKLMQVDFGVNMDGWSRARIAKVVVAMVDAERHEVASDLKRASISMCEMTDFYRANPIKAVTIDTAQETIKNRYDLPDLPVSALWSAAQPNKDWKT